MNINAPINYHPPGAMGGEGWGFDQTKILMPHCLGPSIRRKLGGDLNSPKVEFPTLRAHISFKTSQTPTLLGGYN